MNIFQKDATLLNAIASFRNELKPLELEQTQKIQAMEVFRRHFLRSFSYEMARDAAFDIIMRQKSFKDVWKHFVPVEKLFGFNAVGTSELERMRGFIDQQLKTGVEAAQIINQLSYDARQKLGTDFTSSFGERIKLWVLQEKIKLEDEGEI